MTLIEKKNMSVFPLAKMRFVRRISQCLKIAIWQTYIIINLKMTHNDWEKFDFHENKLKISRNKLR